MSILRQRYQQKSILYLLRRTPDFDSSLPSATFARYLALPDRAALNHGTARLSFLQKRNAAHGSDLQPAAALLI
jgi:hypothetical protein